MASLLQDKSENKNAYTAGHLFLNIIGDIMKSGSISQADTVMKNIADEFYDLRQQHVQVALSPGVVGPSLDVDARAWRIPDFSGLNTLCAAAEHQCTDRAGSIYLPQPRTGSSDLRSNRNHPPRASDASGPTCNLRDASTAGTHESLTGSISDIPVASVSNRLVANSSGTCRTRSSSDASSVSSSSSSSSSATCTSAEVRLRQNKRVRVEETPPTDYSELENNKRRKLYVAIPQKPLENDSTSMKGMHAELAHRKVLADIFEGAQQLLRDNGELVRDRDKKLLELVDYFARMFGDDGSKSLIDFLGDLRNHTHKRKKPNLTQDCNAQVPFERAITAYRRQAASGASAAIDTRIRNIYILQLSREYETIVEAVRDPGSEARRAISSSNHAGRNKRVETIATDYLLKRTEGIEEDSKTLVARVARKRLQALVSQGRLFDRLETTFGIGIFAFIPAGKQGSFRGWKQPEVNAVCVTLADRFPALKEICNVIEQRLLGPLLYEGKDGRVVVEEFGKYWKGGLLQDLPREVQSVSHISTPCSEDTTLASA